MGANAEPRPDLRTEPAAGVTTFLTMAYIVVINPLILSGRGSERGRRGHVRARLGGPVAVGKIRVKLSATF